MHYQECKWAAQQLWLSFLLHRMMAGFLSDHAPQASIRVAPNPTGLGFRLCKSIIETHKI
jgi:hypothetical protein